jgi:hypothetical protein
MRFQLSGPWPADPRTTPIMPGQTIDTDRPEWAWLADRILPPNAIALDQETYDHLAMHYDYWKILTGNSEIVRHQDK